MAAPATKNNNGAQVQASKKKKGKGERRTKSPSPSAAGSAPPNKAASANPSESQDCEHPYLKELAKSIRNCNKKLGNVNRTESVVMAHPDKSLDDMVASKIINSDQKAQILNKPALLTKLAEAELKFNQYKKIQTEYQEQRAADKKLLEETLAMQTKKQIEEVVAETEAKADKKLRETLLSVSQFLAVAAARRTEAPDGEGNSADENHALEGCLLHVYYGNEAGVDAMLKISGGSVEKTHSVENEPLETTYAQVKGIAAAYAAALYAATSEIPAEEEQHVAGEEQHVAGEEQLVAGEVAASEATDTPEAPVETDSLVANAPAAEVAAGDDVAAAVTNGHTEEASPIINGIPHEAAVADDAAAESQNSPTSDPIMTQSWVTVPRDPVEAETGAEAPPAALAHTQSWSDEVAHVAPETSQPAAPRESNDDGFTAVQRKNPRESRGDGFRGRGRGGRGRGDGFRGRGSRGDHRGRGRGGMGGRRPEAPSS